MGWPISQEDCFSERLSAPSQEKKLALNGSILTLERKQGHFLYKKKFFKHFLLNRFLSKTHALLAICQKWFCFILKLVQNGLQKRNVFSKKHPLNQLFTADAEMYSDLL